MSLRPLPICFHFPSKNILKFKYLLYVVSQTLFKQLKSACMRNADCAQVLIDLDSGVKYLLILLYSDSNNNIVYLDH